MGDYMTRGFQKHFSIIIAIIGLLIGASIGTAASLVIHELPTEYISLYQNSYAESHFRIDCFTTHIADSHKIIITVVLRNTDDVTHSANVTVILYTANGAKLAEKSKVTGDVSAADKVKLTFMFNVDVSKYNHAFIQIRDLS